VFRRLAERNPDRAFLERTLTEAVVRWSRMREADGGMSARDIEGRARDIEDEHGLEGAIDDAIGELTR